MALSGIFIIFRIEQLSRDEAKYYEDILWFLRLLPDYCRKLKEGILRKEEILSLDEYTNILNFLDKRDIVKYKETLENITSKFVEIRNKINGYNYEDFREEKLSILTFLEFYFKYCAEKGDLINYNRTLKNKILDFFKLPFILGVILIVLTIFFLPMLKSNTGFWFEIPFQLPSNLIIGTLVSLTIMVILSIMLVIYYSMWSDEAKRTLI